MSILSFIFNNIMPWFGLYFVIGLIIYLIIFMFIIFDNLREDTWHYPLEELLDYGGEFAGIIAFWLPILFIWASGWVVYGLQMILQKVRER